MNLNDMVWENINWINLAQDRISSSCKHRYFYTYTKEKCVYGKREGIPVYATKAHKEWRYSWKLVLDGSEVSISHATTVFIPQQRTLCTH
jgi:hypothetical protein